MPSRINKYNFEKYLKKKRKTLKNKNKASRGDWEAKNRNKIRV